MSRPAVAYIDQAAFTQNIRFLQSQAPESELLLVIKADAYGHGVENLLSAFEGRRVAVACAEEALALFELGFSGEVVLLEGLFNEECVQKLSGTSAIFAIHSVEQLDQLEKLGYSGSVWLKLDSGMHRLGLNAAEFNECLRRIEVSEKIVLETVMTHFASADDRRSASMLSQVDCFKQMLSRSSLEQFSPKPSLSLCNSAALLLHRELQEQIVRPGIALYGGSAAPLIPSVKEGLQPVMHLKSEVIALREIDMGETVGYGDTWTALRKSRIATVAMGYGDGYPRHSPSGTPVIVNGQRASIAGRVSMDLITIDVTDIANVHLGSEVEFWGAELSIDEVADHVGTISYQLCTAITGRVPRVPI
jgi:alanine racemase